jgi:predicted transposase/invertase (TIGR01784 family)
MYADQLHKGENYALAEPALSICLLNHVLFRDTRQAHHRFQMMDRESGRELQNAIEVHTVELTKYNLEETTISQASKLEQWAFLLLRAQDYSADDLTRLLPGLEFETAINTIQIISEEETEDKQMYDQREKAQRDYEWALSGAREEGREEGRTEKKDVDMKGGALAPNQGFLGFGGLLRAPISRYCGGLSLYPRQSRMDRFDAIDR